MDEVDVVVVGAGVAGWADSAGLCRDTAEDRAEGGAGAGFRCPGQGGARRAVTDQPVRD